MNVEPQYNLLLVALSYVISVFGSYTGLQLVSGIRQGETKGTLRWIIAASLALGGGAIWAMHFIGMLAYDMGMPMAYDTAITLFSLLVAVFVVGVGLYIVAGHQDSMARLLLAGFITGLGVSSMHYIGMEAMIMAADMTYDTLLLVVSIIIGIVAATAALWLAFNLTGNLQKLGAAFVMGIAVCGMHYTGMAAMTMTHNHSELHIEASLDPMTMGLMIFCFSMLLLVLALIVALSQLSHRMYEELEGADDIDQLSPDVT